MSSVEYKVALDAFEGPLDLLLYLIRRAEVDITDIPIAAVTTQYLEFLRAGGGLETLDIEQAGEFLVMAATLMEIKSRTLMPPEEQPATLGPDGQPLPVGAVPEALDPRADLVKQLLAYKRFRDAASALEHRRELWERRFPAGAAGTSDAPEPETGDETDIDLGDLQLVDLVSAFAQIMETIDFSRVGQHSVRDDETPIEIHQADILDQLTRSRDAGGARRSVRFAEVFAGRSKGEMIGLFLALLELLKQQRVSVRQDEIHGEIVIEPTPDANEPPAPGVLTARPAPHGS